VEIRRIAKILAGKKRRITEKLAKKKEDRLLGMVLVV
jgi:hypothetical protein